MRAALEQVFSGLKEIEAVAFCGDRDQLMVAIERERPDAVLTNRAAVNEAVTRGNVIGRPPGRRGG